MQELGTDGEDQKGWEDVAGRRWFTWDLWTEKEMKCNFTD